MTSHANQPIMFHCGNGESPDLKISGERDCKILGKICIKNFVESFHLLTTWRTPPSNVSDG